MEIGKKVKKLRTVKLMTQSELAGTQITRNMLSCIENGTAQPSLGTIYYLAERLKVSPGYLLADETDEEIYRKHNQMVNIKNAFLNGNFRICRDICLHAGDHLDDETQLILSEATLNIGIEEFCQGRLREACIFFDECVEHCAKTIYYTGNLLSIAGAYFRYMRMISATLGSNVLDEAEISLYPGISDDFCRYVLSLEQEASQEYSTVSEELLPSKESPWRLHLEAKQAMARGNYSEAYECLHRLLLEDRLIAEPVLYFVFCDLEICCKEIENYKGAYEYAADKIALLQKLLT